MNEPGYVAETLAWCNKQRIARGKRPLKKLPKGEPRNSLSCPCGKATGLRVTFEGHEESLSFYAHEASDVFARNRIPYPRSVQRFVLAFDAGRLPQYEERS